MEKLNEPEKWFPLRVLVCENCWLVQTEDFAQTPDLFGADYAYFSGFSASWLLHAQRFVGDVTRRFALNEECHVVEVASNDGYLLQYVKALNIPCTGIEPTASTAAAARGRGLCIVEEFFGTRLAEQLISEGKQADLAIANNVLGHVPDIDDFVKGFSVLLKPHGVAAFEFPHLLKLLSQTQFDTIYHEHFSYLSLTTVCRIFRANGLEVFDVEEYPTHGGSLRVFAQRSGSGRRESNARVDDLLRIERAAGMSTTEYYVGFQAKTDGVKDAFLSFLLDAKRQGKTLAAYGAAAKGNTLLNYAGVHADLISFVADRNPAKLGKFMPGSRIPIVDESRVAASRPDYVVIFPWNLKAEVMQQLHYIREWDGVFVTAVPRLELH